MVSSIITIIVSTDKVEELKAKLLATTLEYDAEAIVEVEAPGEAETEEPQD